jgi:hypothetical protein
MAGVLALGERLSYKRVVSLRAVIARKEVRRASDAFESPENHDTRLPLASGSLRPQQLMARLGHAIEQKASEAARDTLPAASFFVTRSL